METFHTAWTRIGLVRDEGTGLMPWMLRIARNRAIDRLRARKRRQLLGARAADLGAFGDGLMTPTEPNEAASPGWHVHESVRTAIRALPPEQQIAVHLSFFQGLSHAEISEQLDVPLGTIKSRLRTAFGKLRVSLVGLKDWVL